VFVYTTAADAQKSICASRSSMATTSIARLRVRERDEQRALRDAEFPKGETHTDEYFGSQEIYRGKFEIAIPYQRTAAADTLALNLKLQGCADHGICYIPQSWNAKIKLPAGPVATLAPDPFAPAQKKFAASQVVAATDDLLPVDQAFVLNARLTQSTSSRSAGRSRRSYLIATGSRSAPTARSARPRVVAEGLTLWTRTSATSRSTTTTSRRNSVRTCERRCARRH
jgi:thiol:disulfide interchange protein